MARSRDWGAPHDAGVIGAVWAAALLKLSAALLRLIAIGGRGTPAARWLTRRLAWVAAAILTVYGAILTAVGLLVQSGAIRASAHADHLALAWHAYLWDPWFLIWGALATTALLRSRGSRAAAITRRERSNHAE